MEKITTNYIMDLLFDNDIFYFQPKQLSILLGKPLNTTYDLIQKLKNQGVIYEIENGKYLVTGYDKKRIFSNPLYVASNVVVPSYVSYWSMLNYYGFTDQVPRMVFLATTKQKKQLQFHTYTFKYIHIKKEKLYGYTKLVNDGFPMFLAEPEKAIIDSIDLPHYAGGIKEVARAIGAALDSLSIQKLIEYAQRFPNKSTISRLGYLFERHGVALPDLSASISHSFVVLNPKKPKSTIWNKKWRINVNEEV
ncbi:MAG: type IV toxin-antitoxin system AbiEi family antitoxin [Candidatus Thermoplasmatota archaeon]